MCKDRDKYFQLATEATIEGMKRGDGGPLVQRLFVMVRLLPQLETL
ncbi:hypothetical protein [Halolactibacillus sp. JCM 19043]|nr:hypothetical protein [Halolactibacillus sp. JCM 19043]